MRDGMNTAPEWQAWSGSICVGAVGSFELHSRHLPLETDNIRSIAGPELG